MSEILVKNGYVYDPKNGVNGDVMDIAIYAIFWIVDVSVFN